MLLKAGGDANLANSDGYTPLHVAAAPPFESFLIGGPAAKGQEDLVKALLDHGAKPDVAMKEGETPLYLAAEAGLAPGIVMLLRKGANANVRRSDGQSPIHSASWRCHLPAVEALVKGGATINAKRSNGDTALHLAAKRAADPYPLPSIRPACLMTAKFLIANGADTNAVDREGRKVEEYLRRAEQRR